MNQNGSLVSCTFLTKCQISQEVENQLQVLMVAIAGGLGLLHSLPAFIKLLINHLHYVEGATGYQKHYCFPRHPSLGLQAASPHRASQTVSITNINSLKILQAITSRKSFRLGWQQNRSSPDKSNNMFAFIYLIQVLKKLDL